MYGPNRLGCSKFVLTLILKHGGPLGLIQHLKSCKPMITNAIEVLPPRTDSKDREETLGFVGRSYRPEAATKGNTPPMAATKPTADSDDSDDGKGDATNDELAIATNLAKLPQNYEETIDQISDFFNYQFQSGPAREFALGLLTEQLMLGPVREMSTYAKMMFVVSCIRNDPLKTFAVKGCSANSLVTPHPDSQNSFVPLVKTAPSSNTSEASAKPEARKASFDVGSDGGSTNGGVNFSSRPPNDYVEPSPPTRVSPRNDMGNDNSGNWSQPLSLSNSFSGQPTHPINRGDPSPPLRTHGYHDRPQMNVTEYVRKNEPSPPMSYPIDPPISEIPRNPREWPRNVVNDIERLTEDYVLQRQVDEEPIFLDVVPTSMICLSEVFYVRNCDAIQTCEQIAIILGQVYDGAKNRVGLGWQRGDAAAAWTMPDEGRGMWRRVMIDRDLGHGQFDVHDVDTGRFFTVGDDVIFPLCDRLVEIPPLAFRCTLGDFVVAKAAIFRERSNIIIKKFEENGGRIELVRKLNDTFHVRLSMPNSEMHVLAYLRSVGIVNTLRKPHNYRY